MAHGRERELDVLRGFALFGVFVVNAAVSGRPMMEVLDPPVAGSATGDWIAWGLLNGFGVMKFVALFSLLFGVGLVLQTERLEAQGPGGKALYLRRLGLLALMGLLHGFLLFEGDILFVYALCGGLLYLCRKWSPRRLVLAAMLLLAVGSASSVGLALLEVASSTGEWAGSAAEQLAEAQREQAAVLEGPLGLTLAYRAENYVGWLVVSSVISFNWRVLALFFLGAAARKRRLFDGGHRRLHRWLALAAFPLGTLIELGVLGTKVWVPEPTALERIGQALATELGSLVLSAGYVGGVLWMVHAGAVPRLQSALAAVGRTALTNYLLQSVFINLLFYWFGLGLWNSLSPLAVLGLVAGIFVLQVVASSLWMRAFSMGPAEWGWRRLTYGRPIPWRRPG